MRATESVAEINGPLFTLSHSISLSALYTRLQLTGSFVIRTLITREALGFGQAVPLRATGRVRNRCLEQRIEQL